MAISKLHAILVLSGAAAVGVPVAAVFVINSQNEESISDDISAGTEAAGETTSIPGTSVGGSVTTEGQQPDASISSPGADNAPTTTGTNRDSPSSPDSESSGAGTGATEGKEPTGTTTQTQPTDPATSGTEGATETTPTPETCKAPDSGLWKMIYKNIVGTTTPIDNKKLKRWEDYMKSQKKDCQGNSLSSTQ